ncbi:MAG: SynChlorMet cassette protein ScmC [Lentisphaerota bacterium]
MLRQIKGDEKTYKLTLSDGKVWGFSATESIAPWLKELSTIMGLKESNSKEADNSLLFLALNKDNLPPDSDLTDWKTYKQGAVYRMWSHHEKPEIFVELNKDFIEHPEIKVVNMLLSLRSIFRHYSKCNGSPVHAALAELNGKGILITASSGTGKSTCSRRFPPRFKPLSDDTALIIRDKDDNFRVHPMPTWSDHLWGTRFSTYESSHSVPLSAIFFLEQSDVDAIVPVKKAIAIQKIFEGLKQIWERCWDKEDKQSQKMMISNLFKTACDIADKTPYYTLKATLHGKFYDEIEKVL